MQHRLLICFLLFGITTSSFAQVGIGTTTPKAFFNVPAGKTVLFGEDTSGLGAKLIWYGTKGALRAGINLTTGWDYVNVGKYSFAMGYGTGAGGFAATGIGYMTNASGNYATSMGYQTFAGGDYSISMGFQTIASGHMSFASGQSTQAFGYLSMAMGYLTTASGERSTAMGSFVSTNNKKGSFIIGDGSTSSYTNDSENQFLLRFAGGYKFYTTDPNLQSTAVGVYLPAGGNAWTTLSDSTRKENFRKVDGASFLQKISHMRLVSWNYKGQDAKLYRHYGPMAQDFFAAFGRDELGVIGEDKSINQADFDGVNLIAIQALIKEVEQLKAENAVLKQQAAETASLRSDMEQIKQQLSKLLGPPLDKASASLKP